MVPIDEQEEKLFIKNMIRTDMVHLSMLPEQANYLMGLLCGIAPNIPKQGKDDFNVIMIWLEKALSYHEFCDVKDNHLERVSE